jgi:hypothetical protein
MDFDFGKVLSRSWQIVWKHKALWIFGILASCARANGGGNSGGSGDSGYQTGQIDQTMEQFGQFLNENLWIIILVVLFIFLLFFIFYAIGMMGRIGLIKGTFKVENGAEALSFGELWSESMPYFWRIFGLNFLIGLAVLVLIVPFVLFGVLTAGVGLLCLIPLLCILVPLSWVLLVIVEQAQAGIVLEDLGMLDGFRRGWEIVKSNPGPIIVMALILGIGGAIVGVIVSLPVIIAVLPIVIGYSVGASQESTTPIIIAAACCLLYFPVLLFLNGILTAYIQSAWTLTFMQLRKPQGNNAPILSEPNA